MKTAITSRISTNKSKQEASRVAGGSNFSVMALQTIVGSSVPSKSANLNASKGASSGGVQVQRSWRVESSSRSTLYPDDVESDEEHILGSVGLADADPDLERHTPYKG